MRSFFSRSDRFTPLRVGIILLWIGLVVALLQRDYFVEELQVREARILTAEKQQSFMGIYYKNERIGYVQNRLVPRDSGFILYQNGFMRLNILEENHPISMEIEATLSAEMLLKQFTFKLSSPFYAMTAHGEVRGQEVHLVLLTGKEKIEDVIQLKRPPFLATHQRGYLLEKGLSEGDKIKIPYFDPVSLTGKDTVIEYRGLEKILIHGRVYKLHHFIENFSGIRISSWLDNTGKVIKEQSPAGFVFIAEPEFMATDIVVKGREILSDVSVPLIGAMVDHKNIDQLVFHLELPDASLYDLNSGRQHFDAQTGLVTVTREHAVPFDNDASCSGGEAELQSTPYIQSGNVMMRDMAASLVGAGQTALEKTRVLASWVFDNLEKRPVIGIPDAMTTLNTLQGDCNEHAALFAALARSQNIPTRVVAGVMFHAGAFYYHAWNEVCVGGRWISLDTTRNQFPADLTHIKFIQGETAEQVKIAALIGKLKITIISSEERNGK